VCATDMHKRNCVRIANCNSLEAPKVTTTTSLLAVCPFGAQHAICCLLFAVVVDRRNFLHSIMCTATDCKSHLSIFLLSDDGRRIPESQPQPEPEPAKGSIGGVEAEGRSGVWPFWRSFTQKVSFP